MIWKPIAGEKLNSEDLLSIDFNATKSIVDISKMNDYIFLSPEEKVQLKLNYPEKFQELDDNLEQPIDYIVELLSQAFSEFEEFKKNDLTINFMNMEIEELKKMSLSKICELVLYLRLKHSEIHFNNLYEGLAMLLPVDMLVMFTPPELDILFCGLPVLDINTLKKATVYENVSPNDK